MRIVLTACFLLICAQDVSAQVRLQERKFGTGRFTDIIPPPPVSNGPGVVRDPALLRPLQVKEWHFDPAQKYQYSLMDTAGNMWYVGFLSSREDFKSSPTAIQGWIMQTEAGCYRFGTVNGSFLVSSKELKGKSPPASCAGDAPCHQRVNGATATNPSRFTFSRREGECPARSGRRPTTCSSGYTGRRRPALPPDPSSSRPSFIAAAVAAS